MSKSKGYKRLSAALETLFLALAGLYLVYRLSKSTTFQLAWPRWFEPYLMRGLLVTALARLLTGPLKRWQTPVGLGLALVYTLAWRSGRYSFLLFLAIFTVGFTDIDHRKALRVYLLTVGVFYAATALAGLLGVITNLVTARAGRGVRSAWGMSYYTDFASLGLFVLMSLWVACPRLSDWAMLPLCGGYMLVSATVAHSNTSTLCAGLLLCAVALRLLGRKLRMRWFEKGADAFALYGFTLMALAMFALMALYTRDTNFGNRLNALTSNRLKLAVEAWRAYGLKPFGTPFPQHGNGFTTFPSNNYNFVDSTYPLVLLRYGWLTLLALGLAWWLLACKAIRCGDRRLVLVMGVIAVHAFSEHHFIESHFNLLVALPLAACLPVKEPRSPEGSRRSDALAGLLTVAVLIIGAILAGPALLSWLKTVLEYRHLGHGEHWLRLMCVLLGAVFGAALTTWGLWVTLRALLGGKGLRSVKAPLAALVLCLLVGAGLWVYADRTIARAGGENAALVAADREALEIAGKAAEAPVYSGVLPAVYRRQFDTVRYAALFEDDLSRLRGATVLMPADTERGAFIDNGFLYVPISEAHALYTGDRAVVEALTEAGYHPTGYYSGERAVDLDQAARLNGLNYAPETGLRLDGADEGMRKGPWTDLYGGRYTVTWSLRLPETADRRDGAVCTLRVSTYKGETVVVEKEIRAEQFDEDGTLSVSIPFTISDSRNAGFEAWAEDGRQVAMVEARFRHTPSYDIHTFFDGRLRKVREEYYSLDGAKKLRKDGWFACDYGYDRYGNVTTIRYYDCDGNPTLTGAGFAMRRREYNAKGQIVREAFYGPDDALIIGTEGYAANERAYDAAGNAVVQRYFGPDGAPFIIADGYAEVHRTFDGEGRVVTETYYGVDGAPIRLKQGYWGIAQSYDAADNVASRKYLDRQGAPLLVDAGYAEVRREYNGQHQIVRETYCGLDGKPVLRKGGYAFNEREYDAVGNAVVQRYFGLDGQPVAIDEGYAEVRRDFNDQRQVIRERYYGVDGRSAAQPEGHCGVETEYDERGNPCARRYLDAEGRPTTVNGGYAAYRRAYNGRRQVIREEYFDAEGVPVAIDKGYAAYERDFDALGNAVSQRYYDREGNLTLCNKGYAEVRREYDGRQKTREAYYGPDGRPVMLKKGYASVEYDYDEAGRLIQTRWLDAEGRLVKQEAGE